MRKIGDDIYYLLLFFFFSFLPSVSPPISLCLRFFAFSSAFFCFLSFLSPFSSDPVWFASPPASLCLPFFGLSAPSDFLFSLLSSVPPITASASLCLRFFAFSLYLSFFFCFWTVMSAISSSPSTGLSMLISASTESIAVFYYRLVFLT